MSAKNTQYLPFARAIVKGDKQGQTIVAAQVQQVAQANALAIKTVAASKDDKVTLSSERERIVAAVSAVAPSFRKRALASWLSQIFRCLDGAKATTKTWVKGGYGKGQNVDAALNVIRLRAARKASKKSKSTKGEVSTQGVNRYLRANGITVATLPTVIELLQLVKAQAKQSKLSARAVLAVHELKDGTIKVSKYVSKK